MRVVGFALSIYFVCGSLAHAVPLVYTGHTINFSKAPGADHTLPANQDLILPDIILTRGETMGIFNFAQEAMFTNNVSPVGTQWAFPNNNPTDTVSASNWQALLFQDWQTSLGGPSNLATEITNGDAVLHLIEQDIYLDIRFTSWSIGFGSGGGFAYERAEITPSADFDRDGDVDGRDFLTWQRNAGAAAPLQTGGDANFDGAVDGADLAVWQGAYGGALSAFSAVPEPSGLLLAGLGVLRMLGCLRLKR